MNNGSNLKHFVDEYNVLNCGCDTPIIHIQGYASPEGTFDFNQQLSASRSKAIGRYLNLQLGIPDNSMEIHPLGEDWDDLYNLVIKDPNVPARDQALDIIKNAPASTRKAQLKRLNGGNTWAYLLNNIFPALRGAKAEVYCVTKIPEPEEEYVNVTATDTIVEVAIPEQAPIETVTVISEPENYLRYPLFALRSNLLLPLLNVGIEVPVSTHWTVGADYYYPWFWPEKSNKDCFELTFISAEARYWFNADKGEVPHKNYMVGHSLAAYGAWGYYDIEHNYKGHQGHGWSAGVDYLYALPIAKGKLRLQFQAAFGIVWSPKAQPYTVHEYGGKLIRQRGFHKNFFYAGPTKVAVSLVMPLWRKVKQSTIVMP